MINNQEEESYTKEELYQEAQLLKEGLEASQLSEKDLNKEIIQLKSDITVVSRKLKEVKNERDNNSSLLLHYQTRISSLENGKNDLLDKYENLIKLYNQSKQEIEELGGQINDLEKSSEQVISFNKESALKENAKLQEEIVRLEEELKTSLGELRTKLEDKLVSEKKYQKQIRDLEKKINGLEKQIKDLT